MPIPVAYRAALLAQVACGNQQLKEFLEGEIDFIWDCQDHLCMPQIAYLFTQLGLIEAAQIFSRNQIDTFNQVAASRMHETFTSRATRRMDSERDSNAKTCLWATATSSQYFNRDSQDWAIGYSETINNRTADRLETGYDKSCRHTTGHGFHFSRVETQHLGLSGERHGPGDGTETGTIDGNSSRFHGTGPYLPIGNGGDGTAWSGGSFPFLPDFGNVSGATPITPASSSEQFCPTPTEEDPDPECQLGSFASLGTGIHYKSRQSIAIPLVGTVSIEFDVGQNRRQYFTCTSAESIRTELRNSRNIASTDGSVRADPNINQTESREHSSIVHLVRKYGSSTRKGNDQTDAEETGKGRANGLAHSESERQSTGDGFSQSRSESFATAHSESHLRRTENATDDQIGNKFGQIAQHLSEMWKRSWERLQLLEKQYAAVPLGASMNCNKGRNPCLCAQRVAYVTLGRVPV